MKHVDNSRYFMKSFLISSFLNGVLSNDRSIKMFRIKISGIYKDYYTANYLRGKIITSYC